MTREKWMKLLDYVLYCTSQSFFALGFILVGMISIYVDFSLVEHDLGGLLLTIKSIFLLSVVTGFGSYQCHKKGKKYDA